MSRWIDADALLRHGQRGGIVLWKDIEDAPSIDIVRCKECRHWCKGDEVYGICYRCPNTRQMRYDDFCSYGESEDE